MFETSRVVLLFRLLICCGASAGKCLCLSRVVNLWLVRAVSGSITAVSNVLRWILDRLKGQSAKWPNSQSLAMCHPKKMGNS